MFQPAPPKERFLIFILICLSVAIVYGLYLFNPNFMNKKPLLESLSEGKQKYQVIPEFTPKSEDVLDGSFSLSLGPERQYFEPKDQTIHYTYIREFSRPLLGEMELAESLLWSFDQESIYVVKKNRLIRLNLDLESQWEFEVQPNDLIVDRATISDTELFLSTQLGYIYRLNKMDGRVEWLLNLSAKVVVAPEIYRSFLYVVTQVQDVFYLVKLNGLSGEVLWNRELIGFTKPSPLTISRATNLVLITDPNGSLLALDANTGNAYWQKKKMGTLNAPAMVMDETAYLANAEGKAFALQLKRKSVVWEIELSAGTSEGFTYIPNFQYLAIMVDNGYVHVLDAKTGESQWRYNTGNDQANRSIIALRLSAKGIKKFEMPWKHQGWAIMLPCTSQNLCLLNPEKGQLMSRFKLLGRAASTPVFIGENIFLSLKDPQKLPWIKSDDPEPKTALAKLKPYSPKPKPQEEKEVAGE